ncbi:MAG: hypothetical protein JNL35_07815 [Sphingopyxis sp.]|nr:hypothetical protein [Sphingopyxis sp.]
MSMGGLADVQAFHARDHRRDGGHHLQRRRAARNLLRSDPRDAAPAFALAQYAAPAQILAGTQQPSDLAYVEAMRHYARAIAYAELRKDKEFAAEIAAMRELETSPAVTAMTGLGLPAPDVIRLATLVAVGRAAHWRGDPIKAVALVRGCRKDRGDHPL